MNIISFTPLTVMFTLSDINNLREITSGSFPQSAIVYKSAPTGNYALYEHSSGSWRHSSLVTNARLLECVNILNSSKKEIADDIEVIGLGKELSESTEEQDFSISSKSMNKEFTIKSDMLQKIADRHGIPVIDVKTNADNLQQQIYDMLSESGIHIETTGEPVKETNSGGACDYYRVGVTHPMSKDQVPYIAECGDIMESLEMTYAEANIFKEIWRTAAERTLGLKKAGNSNVRAAEKVVFFADRYYQQNVHSANITDSRKVTK